MQTNGFFCENFQNFARLLAITVVVVVIFGCPQSGRCAIREYEEHNIRIFSRVPDFTSGFFAASYPGGISDSPENKTLEKSVENCRRR